MGRLSDQAKAAWSTVKCPGCSTRVDPKKLVFEDTTPTPAGSNGKRWSFLWSVPRGDFCPNCDFPLSRYFGRLKWIRTLMVGLAVVLVSLAAQMVGNIAGFSNYEITRNAIRIGAAVSGVGIIGIIVGGRHGTVRISDRM